MNLHHDYEAFSELIIAASNELHIPPGIIEKDYYVTLALRELASRVKGMVFKGGTSLTKCYQILDRFSEDIDISYSASEGVPGESRKRQLKKAVVSSIESMGFSVTNLEETRSRRSYNCYRAGYSSIYSPLLELKPELVIETYIALLPFPTVNRMTDNYIYRFLKMTGQEELAEEFDLMPFEITTQAIERTLIDKVFALCDYYLSDKVERHSRHLYDIYKIMEYTNPDASLSGLVQEVRSLREPLPVCPSAKAGVCINDVLAEIADEEVYRNDYETITEKLLFTYVPYETVIGGVIAKERTGSGLNKRAIFSPSYSAHFRFFRIEQSRVRYGDSIPPSSIPCQLFQVFYNAILEKFSGLGRTSPLPPDVMSDIWLF